MGELFSKSRKAYGDEHANHLFEQYKLYLIGIERVSDRRQAANNYFLAINTAISSLIGLSQSRLFEDLVWARGIFSLLGLVTCIIFWYLIRSYKQLNSGKFLVLHEMEKSLPLAPYQYEWEILGKGENKNTYYPFSHIELFIPWIFGLFYLALAVFFLKVSVWY